MPVPITSRGYSKTVKIFDGFHSSFKLITCVICVRTMFECYACKCWIWKILPHKCEFTLLEEELKKLYKGEVNARYLIDESPCEHIYRIMEQNEWVYFTKKGNEYVRDSCPIIVRSYNRWGGI